MKGEELTPTCELPRGASDSVRCQHVMALARRRVPSAAPALTHNLPLCPSCPPSLLQVPAPASTRRQAEAEEAATSSHSSRQRRSAGAWWVV